MPKRKIYMQTNQTCQINRKNGEKGAYLVGKRGQGRKGKDREREGTKEEKRRERRRKERGGSGQGRGEEKRGRVDHPPMHCHLAQNVDNVVVLSK